MSEDIVSALSCNHVINHICPDPSSIVNYFSEVLQHSLDRHAPYVCYSFYVEVLSAMDNSGYKKAL